MRIRLHCRIIIAIVITVSVLGLVALLFRDDDVPGLRRLLQKLYTETARKRLLLALPIDEAKKKLIAEPRRRQQILVVSGTDGQRSFANATRRQLQAYCDHRNYDLFYFDRTLNPQLSPWWQKI